MDVHPRILIVEDDVDLAEVTCELFGSAGLSAIYRTSVVDALDALVRHAGDIVLVMTDINLQTPMSGIELAVYIAEEWPDIALCVASGITDERPRRLPDKAFFLCKPWEAHELVTLAARCCTPRTSPA